MTDTFLRSQMDQMSSVSVQTIAKFNRIRQHAAYAPHETIVEMVKEACTSSTRVQLLEVLLGTPPVVADYRISAANTLQDGNVVASANDLLPGPPPVAAGPNQWADHMYPVSYIFTTLYSAFCTVFCITVVFAIDMVRLPKSCVCCSRREDSLHNRQTDHSLIFWTAWAVQTCYNEVAMADE